MTIYIDKEFKCHVSPGDGLTAVETDFFDGKCNTYIEGYRFVPSGESWTRPDGVTFQGEMIAPATDWQTLDNAQRDYEREQYQTLAEENTAITEENATLAVALDELDAEYQKGVDSL